jgi:hypothetical protein
MCLLVYVNTEDTHASVFVNQEKCKGSRLVFIVVVHFVNYFHRERINN